VDCKKFKEKGGSKQGRGSLIRKNSTRAKGGEEALTLGVAGGGEAQHDIQGKRKKQWLAPQWGEGGVGHCMDPLKEKGKSSPWVLKKGAPTGGQAAQASR